MKLAISLITSYLVGGIPIGFLVGKITKNIDVRKLGTKNIGATNVFHVIGKVPGILTFVLDLLKPVFAMWLASKYTFIPVYFVPLVGAASVVGNLWSPFLKFKGGRGLSATIGYFIYTMPCAVPLLAIITFIIVVLTKWNLPVGGLSLYIIGPIVAAKVYHYPRFIIYTTLFLGLFVLVRQLPWMIIHLTNFYSRRKQYGKM